MNATQQLTLTKQVDQAAKMQGYYRFHAQIYDMTRWSFLFGRRWLLDLLPYQKTEKPFIMEVGCGTGHNLTQLTQRYPTAKLMGLDVSASMLDIADKKLVTVPNAITLKQRTYGIEPTGFDRKPDCILFSYCLTMVNPDWEKLILQAKTDMNTEGGIIAIVDFHQSKRSWFRRWMQVNHVRMEGHILPFLTNHFETVKLEKRRAYFGLWSYFLYIGKLKQ
jgi:S-adenosylmethionine-diacylgycerolhomoserine-N-methlytransferase